MAFRCCLLTILLSVAAFGANDPQPPAFRLPTFAAPQHYSVVLTVAPDKDTFTGSVDIDLNFKEASQVLWLNAEKLTVKDATITVNGQSSPATVIPQPKDLVGFTFDHPVGPGKAKLHVNYQGVVDRKDMSGIFQVKDGDNWYVYSQFENIWARRAIPCFDEPGYKVPWQVTLNVPKEDAAFSNTPQVSETPGTDGMKTVKFAETKPLSSYLVAITVGPMEIVDAGHTGANHTQVRIIVPRGRTAEAKYVASITPDIVNLLEKYFGIPYPYEKLDQVAIPFAGYAMEHPGLVTYGAGAFLFKPESPIALKRLSASVIAHELAHQWFGDLVTTAWWEDIWLNEGFASWTANKIINEYKPEWKAGIGELNGYQGAMDTDELVSSRKVRQEILSDDDIANAFDNITYNKGSALLNMFESYMGPDKFQAGVRRYLHKYSYANATSAQFFEALSGDDPRIGKAFSTFLDQAGVPLVTTDLKCGGGKAELELSQQRFLPRGSQGSANQLWSIPVCVKYSNGGHEQRECTLMTDKKATFKLTKAKSCPLWVYGNAGEAGYYRTLYNDGMLGKVVNDDKALTLPERVGVVGDVASLAKGYMSVGEAMALVPKFAKDSEGRVVTKTLGIVGDLDDFMVPQELLPKYRKYISDLYKARALQLGWRSKPGESDDDRLLRPALLRVVANRAQDTELIDQAKKLANEFLSDRKAVSQDMAGVVLGTAARHGDRALFDRIHEEAKKETDENLQRFMISAMGQFPDPAILKDAYATILNGEFDPRIGITVLFAAPPGSVASQQMYEFVKANWDALLSKLPGDYSSFLPFAAGNFCDTQHRADAEAFFAERAAKVPGGPRNLQQAIEGASLCAANKEADQAGVVEFLKGY